MWMGDAAGPPGSRDAVSPVRASWRWLPGIRRLEERRSMHRRTGLPIWPPLALPRSSATLTRNSASATSRSLRSAARFSWRCQTHEDHHAVAARVVHHVAGEVRLPVVRHPDVTGAIGDGADGSHHRRERRLAARRHVAEWRAVAEQDRIAG